MTLRKKVLLIVSATIVALVVILHAASQIILLRGVANLEEQVASQNVQRAVNALTDELDTLNATAGDWAAWDDTYNFVEDANSDYIESNLVDLTFANLRLNLMLFVNSSGQVVLARGFNLNDEREIPLANSLGEEMLRSNGLLLHHSDPHSSITGIVMLSEGPMLVASRPIVASGYEGPIRGTLIMGRYLDSAEVSRLSEKAHLSISLSQFSDAQVGRSYLSDETPLVVRPLNAESVAGYFLLKDVYGNPALVLKVDMPRDIYKQGAGSVSYFMWALLAFGLVFGVVVLLLLEKVVLSRLARLDAVVSDIAASGDLSERVAIRGSDELSNLAGAINRMLEGLEQSRAALRESGEKYRDLVERANDGIIIVQDGLLKYVNLCLAEMSGYTVEELTDTPFTNYVDSDELPKLVDFYERRMAGERGVIPVYETRLRHRDGSRIEVELNAGTIAYQGRPADLVFVRDITERKQAEREIEERRQYLEVVLEAAPDAIITLDAQYQVVEWNSGAEKLFGYIRDEVIGRNLDPLVTNPDTVEEAVGFTQTVMNGEDLLPVEAVRYRKDGSPVDVILAGSPILVGSEPVGAVAVYTDITERKRVEEEGRKAKEAAEAAAQAKSEFLANMSHEIRTPLNAVIGMTGLLLDTELTAEQLDFVETVRTSGETLLTIINDILDFSKIEAGKLGLEQQPFDLRECIEVSLDLVTSRATEKGLNLAYLIEDNTPGTLVGDVTRLRQILVNLLSNAVKFTNSGEVVVSVTSRPLPLLSSPPLAGGTEGAYEVHFTVRDTGIGIPQDSIERLFQSFSQVDVSTTRRYGGTGLGLAISKRLAEMMGGTMWVESEVGKGSTFHFTVVAEAAAGRESECSCSPEPQLAGKRILIVDDNETNQQILTRQTESWGMLPRAAGSGSEALDWVRRGDPFDVAILDMQMPEMDGLTLAAEIRKHGDMQSLPLVMLTSMGQREEAAQSVEFAAYLTKPVKSSQLCDVLMGIFAGRTNRVRKPEAQSQFDSQMGHRHPLHILLAEDNVVNQKVALRILERMGYRADLAANGLEVLEALDRQHYDVVLMDVQMPEMDGEEATRQIHKRWPDGDGRRPRIVAMTAHSLSGDRERYLGMGMDDYISKPVRVEELTAALERCQPHAHDGRTVGSSLAPDAVSRPTTAAIDPVDLERFREMMGEAGTELIALFLEETLDLLAELREAVAKGDAESLQRVAHTLKGSSATLGAMRLSDLCKELEIMGRRGALEGAAEKVAQVETEYERVRVTLE